MFLLSKPDRGAIYRFLDSCRDQAFSYPEVGATRHETGPDAYNIDHNRIRIGRGRKDFEHAKAAIKKWTMFSLDWVGLYSTDTPISPDENVAVLASHFGFYSLNGARIVYVIEETDRFGFAYGTLTDHGEIGEERFLVNLDAESGDVSYDIYAFSRPGLFARLGYPLSRNLQKRFAQDSMNAMRSAVPGGTAVLE